VGDRWKAVEWAERFDKLAEAPISKEDYAKIAGWMCCTMLLDPILLNHKLFLKMQRALKYNLEYRKNMDVRSDPLRQADDDRWVFVMLLTMMLHVDKGDFVDYWRAISFVPFDNDMNELRKSLQLEKVDESFVYGLVKTLKYNS